MTISNQPSVTELFDEPVNCNYCERTISNNTVVKKTSSGAVYCTEYILTHAIQPEKKFLDTEACAWNWLVIGVENRIENLLL